MKTKLTNAYLRLMVVLAVAIPLAIAFGSMHRFYL
jgi:hypothetical protein